MGTSGRLLHVVGGGPWQVPTIRRAKAMGLRVLVTDGFADRPGYALSDQHEVVDIKDLEATLDAARRHGIDGILCDTTDTGVLTAAYVAEHLGLPGVGLEAARRCTDKALMTESVAAAGLRVPRSHLVSDVGEFTAAVADIGLPLVVKPVDAQGGRGVSVVSDVGELKAAYGAALAQSRHGRVLVQVYVHGVEVIVDSLVVAGTVHRLGLARKEQYADNPTVSVRITYGAEELPVGVGLVDAANIATIRALGIRQGLVHAEYLIDQKGPLPVDVAARGGGVMIYSKVLPHVSGVDAMEAAICLALGLPIDIRLNDPLRGANIEFLRASPGRITGIDGVEGARALPGVEAVHLFHGVGDSIRGLLDKEDRLGFVVATAQDGATAVERSHCAAAMVQVQVERDPTGDTL